MYPSSTGTKSRLDHWLFLISSTCASSSCVVRVWEIQYVHVCLYISVSKCVFAPLCPHLHLSSPPHVCVHMHVCVSPCVCSALAWGSICVRLTRWEPLSAGSPGGPKSSGRLEAWNPSRPGQMSLCSARLSLQRPHRPLKTLGADSGSQNADQTVIAHTHKNKLQAHQTKKYLSYLDILVSFNWIL